MTTELPDAPEAPTTPQAPVTPAPSEPAAKGKPWYVQPFRPFNHFARKAPVAAFWTAVVVSIFLGYASAQSDVDAAKLEAAEARSDADQARVDAEAQAAENMADDLAALEAREAKLDARAAKVGAAEKAAKANQFDGTGTFLVGVDVKAGTYRAAASPGCYWERLRDLNGGIESIIENDNADGPIVLQVGSGDKAIQVNGCATFKRMG